MYRGLYICRRCAAAVHDMFYAVYVCVTHVAWNLQQASSLWPPWAAVSYVWQQCQDDIGVVRAMLWTWASGLLGCRVVPCRLGPVMYTHSTQGCCRLPQPMQLGKALSFMEEFLAYKPSMSRKGVGSLNRGPPVWLVKASKSRQGGHRIFVLWTLIFWYSSQQQPAGHHWALCGKAALSSLGTGHHRAPRSSTN